MLSNFTFRYQANHSRATLKTRLANHYKNKQILLEFIEFRLANSYKSV